MHVTTKPARIQYKHEPLLRHIRKHYWLYFMMIPGLAFFLIFHYAPMYGITIAFKKFSMFRGISASPWIGLAHFEELFGSAKFAELLRNSVLLSLYKLLWGFPAPILIALLLNEVRKNWFKRTVQTVIYLPHFISWVVVSGILVQLLSPNNGVINLVIKQFGGDPIFFLSKKEYFRTILVASDIWKEAGWGTIIYLAALSGVDEQLYEAAVIDGAGRFRQLWHITLPGIKATIIIMLILRMGSFLDSGFDQIYLMLNSLNREVATVFDTYVYDVGLQATYKPAPGISNYSYSATVGVFRSIVSLVLVLGSNAVAKLVGEEGVY